MSFGVPDRAVIISNVNKRPEVQKLGIDVFPNCRPRPVAARCDKSDRTAIYLRSFFPAEGSKDDKLTKECLFLPGGQLSTRVCVKVDGDGGPIHCSDPEMLALAMQRKEPTSQSTTSAWVRLRFSADLSNPRFPSHPNVPMSLPKLYG
jgi:hypothetical protein